MSEWLADIEARAARAARPLEGRLEAPGLAAEVEVLTDHRGVPHVYAGSRQDLYFAQGLLHATERLWQVEMARRTAQGRLSEVLGERGLVSDRLYRTMGLARLARAWVASADADTLRIVSGYGAGFAAGARALPAPVEHGLLAIEPEVPAGPDDWLASVWSIALLWSFQLTTAWDFDLVQCCLAGAPGAPEDFETHAAALVEELRGAEPARAGGSNNWAVGGSRTVSGRPLLAADPHVTVSVPGAWMEMHLACPDLEVAGLTVPGIPGVVMGHNRRVAWAFTNSRADVDDLYLERLSADGARCRHGTGWRPVRIVREEIAVRHEDRPRVHEVRVTPRGPLITPLMRCADDGLREAVALRWVHAEVPPTLAAVEGMNAAGDWEEFRRAARRWAQAPQNVVYADVDGDIAEQLVGPIPLREPGARAGGLLQGWTGGNGWRGIVPFDDLPWRLNPPEGVVASANHDVAAGACPHHLGSDWELPHRIRRIRSVLGAGDRLGLEDMTRLQLDTRSGIAAELLPRLLAALPTVVDLRERADLLRRWDLRMEPGSVAASIFGGWAARIVERLLRPALGDERYRLLLLVRSPMTSPGYAVLRDLAERPREAGALLAETLREAPAEPWGRLRRFRFDHPMARTIGALSGLLSAGDWPGAGSDDTVRRAAFPVMEECGDAVAATARFILDLSNWDRSVAVLAPGNSGSPASPHYRDQVEGWARGGHGLVPFSRSAVEAHSGSPLTLVPAGPAAARTGSRS